MKKPAGYRMQEVKFRDVEAFLDFLPEDERQVTDALRELVYRCIPDVKEKLSFQVPFFSRYRQLCFIWPGSVLWGKNRIHPGVRFGFNYGKQLTDPENKLLLENRKSVAYQDFVSIEEIDFEQMEAWLYESVILDDERRKRK